MPVEHVYTIPGRGTVVTGRIERGKIKKGVEVQIIGQNAKLKTVVTGEYQAVLYSNEHRTYQHWQIWHGAFRVIPLTPLNTIEP